jgi:hypothetical protein
MIYVDIPARWMVYFMENPNQKWMRTHGNIPSGKRLTMEHHPFLMSKSTNFLWPFSIAMFDITRG